jgi:hypothetical protein
MAQPVSTISEESFARAARQQWQQLAAELREDIAAYGKKAEAIQLRESDEDVRVENALTGLSVVLTPDFEAHTVRYDFESAGGVRGGAPEGGLLSMRPSATGDVEFYTADERLTSQQVRRLFLDPIFVSGRPV